MHELRKDPILSRWVAVLSEGLGPDEYLSRSARRSEPGDDSCPLCAGREAETPPETEALREGPGGPPDTPGWSVRVVPNSAPLLSPAGNLGRKGLGMYDAMNAVGINELIIESPEHLVRPEDIGPEQVHRVVRTYRSRLRALNSDEKIRYVLICKNSGAGSGSALTHPHAELIATPVIPLRIKAELDGAKEYYRYKERCIFCDILDEELRVGERIVLNTEMFVAFCPYAPKYPFEFWVVPKTHRCSFEDISDPEAEALGGVLAQLLGGMRRALGDPSYNYVIHTAPNRIPRRDHWHTLGDDYHWHIEVVPRLRRASGFEWGSGFYVVPTSPEDAAGYLRDAL